MHGSESGSITLRRIGVLILAVMQVTAVMAMPVVDSILENIALGHAQGRCDIDTMIWNESFNTGKWKEGVNGEPGLYEAGYCLIGLPTLEHVDALKQAILEVRILVGSDNDFKTYWGYLEVETPENGWPPMVVRLQSQI